MYCIVGMCEVSPKMEKQGSFLFLVFGVTCSLDIYCVITCIEICVSFPLNIKGFK
jgi:hypothetical protein